MRGHRLGWGLLAGAALVCALLPQPWWLPALTLAVAAATAAVLPPATSDAARRAAHGAAQLASIPFYLVLGRWQSRGDLEAWDEVLAGLYVLVPAVAGTVLLAAAAVRASAVRNGAAPRFDRRRRDLDAEDDQEAW